MKIQIVCQYCESSALKKNSRAKFCSNACRQASYRQRNRNPIKSIESELIRNLDKLQTVVVKATKKEQALAILNRVDGHMGLVGERIERNGRKRTRISSPEDLAAYRKTKTSRT